MKKRLAYAKSIEFHVTNSKVKNYINKIVLILVLFPQTTIRPPVEFFSV